MCNGHSSRMSKGGAIVVFKPASAHRQETPLVEESSLRLSESCADPSRTAACIDGMNGGLLGKEIVIQSVNTPAIKGLH